MNNSLKPIKPKRVSDQVFEQIRELIFRSEFKPGQQLPPERELTTSLGVSRTSVRNAISKLVALGYLVNKQGQGTFVCSPDSLQSNPLALALRAEEGTLEDLLEVRMGLECNSAALAAERAVEEDIKILEDSLAKIKDEVNRGKLGTDADVSFHMAIAFATKNPIQVQIMKSFYDLLFYGIEKSRLQLSEDPKHLVEIYNQHKAIFEAIRNHNSEMAFRSMKRHIRYVMDFARE